MVRNLLVSCALLLIAGCGLSDVTQPIDSAQPSSKPPETVRESLDALGVALLPLQDARVEEDGRVRHQLWAPLGQCHEAHKPMELFVAGASVSHPDVPSGRTAIVECTGPDDLRILDLPDEARWRTARLRQAVRADVDGDGLDETVIVYTPVEPSAGDRLGVTVVDDAEGGFAATHALVDAHMPIADVRAIDLAAGRVLEGGAEQVAVATSGRGSARLAFLEVLDGNIALLEAGARTFQAQVPSHEVTLFVAVGSVNHDLMAEVAVVFNQTYFDIDLGRETGLAPVWHLYEQPLTSEAPVQSGTITREASAIDAIYGNVGFCDVDGDFVHEIVLAGLTRFESEHSQTSDDDRARYVIVVLEDQEGAYAEVDSLIRDVQYGCFERGNITTCRKSRHVFIESGDLDDDGKDEFLVNEYIFENLSIKPLSGGADRLPGGAFFPEDLPYFDRNVASLSVGDADADGVDDIILLTARHRDVAHEFEIRLFGKRARPRAKSISLAGPTPTDDAGFGDLQLQVLPINVDDDSEIFEAVPGSHQIDYTEAIPIAALAAAPCQFGVGQNIDNACATTLGDSRSQSDTVEQSYTLSAGFEVGLEIENGAVTTVGFEVAAGLKRSVGQTTGITDTVTRSVVYSTGPAEDVVLFVTVPYDSYTYRVVRHTNKEILDNEALYRVLLPRRPEALLVQRGFFNRHTTADGIRIGDDVFQHEIGHIATYPTVAKKEEIRLRAHEDAYWEVGPVNVGQGTGSVEVSIAIGHERAESTHGTKELSGRFKVTAGAFVEFSFSEEFGWANTITVGQEMTYTGVVGNIDEDNYLDHRYAFGLFTYRQALGEHVIDVINYWVE